MLSDLKFALRQLTKSPGFTFVAVATLALGIGVCTAMFSIVRAVLLKPLPFHEPDQLVWIENKGTDGLSARTSRADTVLGWREHAKSFESLAAWFAFSDYGSIKLTGKDQPERLRNAGVSDNFLPTLGVQPLYGRNFNEAECKWSNTNGGPGIGAVILGHGFWLRHFAGDPAVVGRQLTLNGQSVTIVGVLPPTFDFAGVFTPGSPVDILTPFPLAPETARWGNTVFGIGRLKAGVTLEQARAELLVVTEQVRKSLPYPDGIGSRVESLDSALRGKFRGPFVVLVAAVACVLAIACVNLSGLLLARLNVRRQEFAVRVALGASRLHLIRQTLGESLLLAFLGALVGLPLAMWATDLLAGLQTFGVPLLQNARVDPIALAVTVGVTTLAGIACGLLPALYLSRKQNSQTLENATHQRSAGRSAGFARSSLIVVEVAMACILLVAAGLLVRSFNALLRVNLGFQPQQAVAWRIDAQRNFKSFEEASQYVSELHRRVVALPGVESVGLSDTLPLSRNRTWGAGATGVQYKDGEFPVAFPRIVDPHYLQAMQIPLISGRNFEEGFNPKAEKAIIINQSLARQLWPDRDPLGQKMDVNGESTVIGVVANVRHGSLEVAGSNEMYLDCRQCGDWSTLEMVVRSTRAPESLIPEVRAALAAFDPGLPTGEYQTLERLIDNAVGPRRLITRLLGFFSGLALLLAVIGLYGVMAFAVAQRRQEIGIRMAIGAQRSDVLRLILQSGLKLVAIGLAVGLAGSLAITQGMRGLLYGISAHDPVVFVVNAALLLGVATAACLIPAVRATKVDPVVALRAE